MCIRDRTRQLEPLERQSETAKIYLKKKEELKILDINMFLLEMERIRNDLTKVEDRYRIAEEQLKSTKEAFEHTKQEYEKLEQEQEKLDQTILSARDQAGENALKRQQLENQIEVLNEQIHASERNSDTSVSYTHLPLLPSAEHLQTVTMRKDRLKTGYE